MTAGQVMNLQEWQRRVDALRITDDVLKRGRWHGYLTEGVAGGPIHGFYAMVRWELPSIAVAHDDPEEIVRIARLLEEAL